VLALDHHCHGTDVSLAAVFGMNVLEHFLSGQRSWVWNVFVKVVDVLCVRAGKTDEGRTLMIFTDSAHS
jgi:hypothetical protein